MRPTSLLPLAATLLILLSLVAPVAFGQINACKYLEVTSFTSDPYGIARELRAQAKTRGFTVVLNLTEVPEDERTKACVMSGSWSAGAFGGDVAVRVVDAVSGDLMGEAATRGTAWLTVSRTVRKAVERLYSQLEYTGFNEDVYRSRMQRLHPTRKMAITEEDIRKTAPQGHLAGIWSDPQDKYRLGIVPAPQGSAADYVAVVLRTNSPLWQPGEIKAEFRGTVSPNIFTCTYFTTDKKPLGTTFLVERNVLRAPNFAIEGYPEIIFWRVWPQQAKEEGKDEGEETKKASSAKGGALGTGFLLNKNGLIATNWHVVAGATHVTFALPSWSEGVTAEIVVKDTANDLAILRATDLKRLTTTCPDFPYQLSSSRAVTLGQHISTIGYPLAPLLGSNPKFTEGVVSSKSGLQDDPRTLQISAPIQPGSSGSPLFDSDGNVIGVVVATLDAGALYERVQAIPQNVNWAIKSDYLLNLMAMLPDQPAASRNVVFSPEKAAQCVALIEAK